MTFFRRFSGSQIFQTGAAVLVLLFGSFLVLLSQKMPDQKVGPLPGGGFLLNSGWTITPAGTQVPVDTLPMSSVVSPDGRFLLVLNAGYNPPSISVIDIPSAKEVGRTPVPDGWLGLQFARTGNKLYVGGGSKAAVYEFAFDPSKGTLTAGRTFTTVAATNGAGQENAAHFVGDVAISPDAHLLYAADLYADSIAVINLQSGTVIDRWKCGRRPYRLLLLPGGSQLVVSSWADASVYQYNANTGEQIARTRVAPHPTDMLYLSKPVPSEEGEASNYLGRLFVAAGNTNNVYSFGVTKDGQFTQLESINFSMTPMHPLGMTPSALGLNQEGTKLYVACSDANAIGVADISRARTHVDGFLPTGWYPTGVTALSNGTLAILNGKGLGSHPNPNGPIPTKPNQPLYQGGPVVSPGYVGHIQTGTVAFVAPFDEGQLREDSRRVLANSPYRDEMIYGPIDDAQTAFFARTQNHESPIQHAIYIIKENRTYDQVLGDMQKGNGDKSLNLFGEKVTPNLHALANDFILYDNFYENADVSADGHNWASAAIAPDFTNKLWPNEYARRSKEYRFEGDEPANTPPAGYIWDNALQAGLTIRDYGQWVTNIPLKQVSGPQQIGRINDPALRGKVDMNYRGFDLDYPDVDRAHEFVREWQAFDAQGNAPNLLIVRMGNDHTQGTKPGAMTPLSFAADNDYAVGLLVDAVSHSKLWASTAIFIIEDDAQNGPDHVDSHRAPAWVLSPYTHRGIVDSLMYNQTSILRTMELALGLRPMTHFDAGARPMFSSFARQADLRPFTAIAPTTSMTDRNLRGTSGAAESARMDWSDADRIDDDELNAVLWRALKHTEPPAPTRSNFAR